MTQNSDLINAIKMDRKEFLSLVGTSIAAITIGNCLQGCKKEETPPSATSQLVDFTLDLNAPANSALSNNGGYMYTNGVIVARTNAGNYIAVSQTCTHQGVTVVYQASGNVFYCSGHGSKFSESGGVTQGPATAPLKQYMAMLNGTTLRVHG